jgi:alcohol dehydrogenase class IV
MTAPEWVHTSAAQQIRFGAGAAREIGRVVRDLGGRRVLLVTTAGRLETDDGRRIVQALGSALISTYAGVRSHVPTDVVEESLRQSRRDGVDTVVSFGGGSCADLGKAVCYFTEQEQGTPGSSHLDRPALLHVSIPTTYSGAALTGFFAMTDPRTRRAAGARGPTVAPVAAIYDPLLTVSTSARVSAETGMSALAHCTECVLSAHRTPEAEAIALAGVTRIVEALPDVVARPTDADARTAMLAGSVLGGRCLQNASMGAHHELAQLLAARTGIAHGLANAVLLPHALRNIQDTMPREAERIGGALGGTLGDPPGDGQGVAGAIEAFVRRLGLPTQLSDCGVDDEDIDVVTRLAEASPDARAILEAAF